MLPKDQLLSVFHIIDVDSKGYISSEDLVRVSSISPGGENVVGQVLTLLRMDQGERLDFEEFCRRVTSYFNEEKQEVEETYTDQGNNDQDWITPKRERLFVCNEDVFENHRNSTEIGSKDLHRRRKKLLEKKTGIQQFSPGNGGMDQVLSLLRKLQSQMDDLRDQQTTTLEEFDRQSKMERVFAERDALREQVGLLKGQVNELRNRLDEKEDEVNSLKALNNKTERRMYALEGKCMEWENEKRTLQIENHNLTEQNKGLESSLNTETIRLKKIRNEFKVKMANAEEERLALTLDKMRQEANIDNLFSEMNSCMNEFRKAKETARHSTCSSSLLSLKDRPDVNEEVDVDMALEALEEDEERLEIERLQHENSSLRYTLDVIKGQNVTLEKELNLKDVKLESMEQILLELRKEKLGTINKMSLQLNEIISNKRKKYMDRGGDRK